MREQEAIRYGMTELTYQRGKATANYRGYAALNRAPKSFNERHLTL